MPVPESVLQFLVESVRIRPPDVTDTEDTSLQRLKPDAHFMVSLNDTRSLNLDKATCLIRKHLYERFYTIGRSSDQLPPQEPVGGTVESGHDTFPAPPAFSFNAGWYSVDSLSVGAFVLLQKQNVRFLPNPGKFVLKNDASPGKYRVLFAEQEQEEEWQHYHSRIPVPGGLQEVRFYFNLNPAYGPRWAHYLKEQLDAYDLPFRLKYWKQAPPYPPRRDTGVLYVSADHYVPTVAALTEALPQIKPLLFKGVPLFVKELLPEGSSSGIGFAETPRPDPKWGQMSFGESRCHRIAEAIVTVWESDGDTDGVVDFKRVMAILEKMPGNEQPFLNPDTRYSYPLTLLANKADFPLPPTDEVLREAVQIGFTLCQEALWLMDETCTWIGIDSRSRTPDGQGRIFMNGILNDEGRTGRKWIAEYLQKLHKVFPHPLFIHTASAARRGQFQKPEPIHNPVVVVNSIVGKPSNLYHQLRLMLHTTPAASRFLRLQRLKRLFEKDLRHDTIHVEDQATVNEIKLPGWYDFFPGLDGLALLGFSYLYAYDPKLVPFKVRKAIAG